MRYKSPQAINSLFGIVAVNGMLFLLPGAAFGASASELPSDGKALVPGVVADVAVSLGCALPEVAAAARESQEGSECENQDGSDRGCTPSENLQQCTDDAVDAVEQCIAGARGLLGRVGCEVGYVIDMAACLGEVVQVAIKPFRGLWK